MRLEGKNRLNIVAIFVAGTLSTLGAGGCSSKGAVMDGGGHDLAVAGDGPAQAKDTWFAPADAPGDSYLWSDLGGSADQQTSAFQEARGLIHLHSIYSHDACDEQGFINGLPNTACLEQLRDAVCSTRLDFVALTDHPSFMADYTLPEDLLYDPAAGDQLVMHQGKPIANRITCNSGHQALLSVGFEATHMMPLGLFELPPTTDLYGGIDDSTALTAIQSQVQSLKALGAVAAMVHSEESNISAATIEAGGFEAMEWYNIHASFKKMLGEDGISFDPQNIPQLTTLVETLIEIGDFMAAGPGAPHPDLVYLLFFDIFPEEGFDKWRSVLGTRHITGILGSDIHRNVYVDPGLCEGLMQLVCAGALGLVEATLGKTIPQAVKSALLQGGPLPLSDGDRIDSYARLMRLLENRVLVSSKDQLEFLDALRAGRSYGIFTLFGAAQGLAFTASPSGGGAVLQMGDSSPGPLTITVKVPAAPVPLGVGGVSFSPAEGLNAELRTRLLRVGPGGSLTEVDQRTGLGGTITVQASQPGAYYVEIWIKPKHLVAALGSAQAQALTDKEFLWVITNPIHLTP